MNIIYRMFVYDFLYTIGDRIIKKYNPCNIQVSRSGLVTCEYDPGICCGGCRYISIHGCTVTCLGCKLGLCGEANNHILGKQPNLPAKLAKIRGAAYSYNLLQIRVSRNEVYRFLKKRSIKYISFKQCIGG